MLISGSGVKLIGSSGVMLIRRVLHAAVIDQATIGVLANDVGERNADGVEEPELSECGLGVELDDLGIVAAESDQTAEWGVGDFVVAEIDVPPLHW
nr:hypothetical protein CFP56_68618 [Quercus suber]